MRKKNCEYAQKNLNKKVQGGVFRCVITAFGWHSEQCCVKVLFVLSELSDVAICLNIAWLNGFCFLICIRQDRIVFSLTQYRGLDRIPNLSMLGTLFFSLFRF